MGHSVTGLVEHTFPLEACVVAETRDFDEAARGVLMAVLVVDKDAVDELNSLVGGAPVRLRILRTTTGHSDSDDFHSVSKTHGLVVLAVSIAPTG